MAFLQVFLLSLQAVRVQDPPHGLPASAASSLQLQEPSQGHPLVRPLQRKRRRMDLSREKEKGRGQGRVIVRRGRGHLHFTKLLRCPLPTLRTVLLWFRLGQMKTKSKDFKCEGDIRMHRSLPPTCTHTYTNIHQYTLGIPYTYLTKLSSAKARS